VGGAAHILPIFRAKTHYAPQNRQRLVSLSHFFAVDALADNKTVARLVVIAAADIEEHIASIDGERLDHISWQVIMHGSPGDAAIAALIDIAGDIGRG